MVAEGKVEIGENGRKCWTRTQAQFQCVDFTKLRVAIHVMR